MTGFLLLADDTVAVTPPPTGTNNVVLKAGAANPYNVRLGVCCGGHVTPPVTPEVVRATPITPTGITTRLLGRVRIVARLRANIQITARRVR